MSSDKASLSKKERERDASRQQHHDSGYVLADLKRGKAARAETGELTSDQLVNAKLLEEARETLVCENYYLLFFCSQFTSMIVKIINSALFRCVSLKILYWLNMRKRRDKCVLKYKKFLLNFLFVCRCE